MSSSPSLPLPVLPTEVKKEILKFCDQPTLAKTSTLSLAFLQLSSPLLYRHIEFEGPDGLIEFLAIVAEKRNPELETWLDLSLVYSITYVDDENHPFNPSSLDDEERPSLEPRRLLLPSSSSSGRLSLHTLKVLLPDGESQTQIHPYFDPVQFELHSLPRGVLSSLRANVFLWTRLQRLVFANAFFDDCLMDTGLNKDSFQGLHVFYDISETFHHAVAGWIDGDLLVRPGEPTAEVVSCIEEVTVLLKTEQHRKSLLERLAGSLLLPRITVLVKSSNESASTDIAST